MKKDITITIIKREVLSSVWNRLLHIGRAMEAGGSGAELVAQVQGGDLPEDVMPLLRSMATAWRGLLVQLQEWLTDGPTSSDDAPMTSAGMLRVTLRLPGNYSTVATDAIADAMHGYLCDAMTADWLKQTQSDKAEEWYTSAAASLSALHQAVTRRARPTRGNVSRVDLLCGSEEHCGYNVYQLLEWVGAQMDRNLLSKEEADALYAALVDFNTLGSRIDEVDTAVEETTGDITSMLASIQQIAAAVAAIPDAYTKAEVDTALSTKADASTMSTALAAKADKSNTYTTAQINSALALKADKGDTYTKTQVDTALSGKADSSTLADVATSGSYNDLTNKPSIPAAQIQADWNQSTNTALDYIKNKPSIPAAQVQADWNQSDNTKVDYIKNKPTIPAAQVQADWNQADTESVDYIKNKPSLGNLADKSTVNRMFVIDGIEDAIVNFGTGYPPSGTTVSGIFYSKSNRRFFAKGSNNNYYVKWNEVTVSSVPRASYEYYSQGNQAAGGIYYNTGDSKYYYIKYNTSNPIELYWKHPSPTDVEFVYFGGFYPHKTVTVNSTAITHWVTTKSPTVLDCTGVTGDITVGLSNDTEYDADSLAEVSVVTSEDSERTSEYAVLIITGSSPGKVNIVDENESALTLKWVNAPIGNLDASSKYLLSIFGDTAVMVKIDSERSYA